MKLFILLCLAFCPATTLAVSISVIKSADKNVQKNKVDKSSNQKSKREAAVFSASSYHGPSHIYLPPTSSVGGYNSYSSQQGNSVTLPHNDGEIVGRYDGNVETYNVKQVGAVGNYNYGRHDFAHGYGQGQSGQKIERLVIPARSVYSVVGSSLNNVATVHLSGTGYGDRGGSGTVDYSSGNSISGYYPLSNSLNARSTLVGHSSQLLSSRFANGNTNNLGSHISGRFVSSHSTGGYDPSATNGVRSSSVYPSYKPKYYELNSYSTTLVKDETPIYALGHKGLGHFSYISSKPQGLNTDFIGSTHLSTSSNELLEASFKPSTYEGNIQYSSISSSYRPQISKFSQPTSSGYDYQSPTKVYAVAESSYYPATTP